MFLHIFDLDLLVWWLEKMFKEITKNGGSIVL